MSDAQGTSPSPFLEEYLAYLLARASHAVSGGFHARLAALGVPVITWRTLAVLRDGPCSVGELASRVLLNQPTMSKALDRLEREGLLRRLRASDNRRNVLVELCPPGRRLLARLLPMAEAHQEDAFAHLTATERRRLVQVLRGIITHNEAGRERPPNGD